MRACYFQQTIKYGVCEMSPKRRRGRPRKAAADRRSEPISLRIPRPLRARLEEARRSGGVERSITDEVCLRLRASFDDNTEIVGPRTAAVLLLIGRQIAAIETRFQSDWLSNGWTFDQCEWVIGELLKGFRPAGRRILPKLARMNRKATENFVKERALLAPALLEQVGDATQRDLDTLELAPPADYSRIAELVKGSPTEKLAKHWQRIQRPKSRREEDWARQYPAIAARTATIGSLDSYLSPRLPKSVRLKWAKIFAGVTGANFTEKKALIIERIKAAVGNRLTELKPAPAVIEKIEAIKAEGKPLPSWVRLPQGIDHDLGRILDAAAVVEREAGNELISEQQFRAMQGRAARKPKGEHK
jgi:hypothetical protein